MARPKNDGRGRIGGRKKGTPNKATATIREAIAAMWKDYHDSGLFQKDIEALDSQTRAAVMEKYAQYVAPKLKTIDAEVSHSGRLTIEDTLATLAGDDEDEEGGGDD